MWRGRHHVPPVIYLSTHTHTHKIIWLVCARHMSMFYWYRRSASPHSQWPRQCELNPLCERLISIAYCALITRRSIRFILFFEIEWLVSLCFLQLNEKTKMSQIYVLFCSQIACILPWGFPGGNPTSTWLVVYVFQERAAAEQRWLGNIIPGYNFITASLDGWKIYRLPHPQRGAGRKKTLTPVFNFLWLY